MTWICSGQYQRRTAAQRLVQEIRLFGFQPGVTSRWAAIRPRPLDVVRQQVELYTDGYESRPDFVFPLSPVRAPDQSSVKEMNVPSPDDRVSVLSM